MRSKGDQSCLCSSWRSLVFFLLLAAMVACMSGCTNANSVVGIPTNTDENDVLQFENTRQEAAGNNAPVLELRATQEMVGFNGEVVLSAEAIDPDGDSLSFSWIAAEGMFIYQQSTQAVWQAPEKNGVFELACLATDGRGGSTQKTVSVEVVGGRVYQVRVLFNRAALVIGKVEENNDSEWVPIAQAKVTLPEINTVAITDKEGLATIDLDQAAQLIGSSSSVIVHYLNHEVWFTGKFPGGTPTRLDTIQFYPGFDGISVATARGDSFSGRLGGVEVRPFEQINGEQCPVQEVTVDVGPGQSISRDGVAQLNPLITSGIAGLRLIKQGYQSIDGYQVPVIMDGVTLIQAQMRAVGTVPVSDASVAWTSPYNGQKSVKVTGPFEIGFAQSMETGTILDNFEVTLQETESRNTIILSGQAIKERFDLTWEGTTILRLTPKYPLHPLRRYSMLINRWTAHTADGRALKNYTGMFGVFTTDADPAPSLLSTSPSNGDTNVPRSGPFQLRFDRPMQPASLLQGLSLEITDVMTGSRVILDQTSLGTEFSIVWSEENRLLSMVPRRQLKPNHPYLVRVNSTGLRSESGQTVEFLDNLWGQFTTGAL